MKLAKRLLPLLLSFGMVFTISSFNSIKVKANVNPALTDEQATTAVLNNPNIPLIVKTQRILAFLNNPNIPLGAQSQVSLLFLHTALTDPNIPAGARNQALTLLGLANAIIV
jgi:hypothetical protein